MTEARNSQTNSETVLCTSCGCESTLPQFFTQNGDVFTCPPCSIKPENMNSREGSYLYLLIAIAGGVVGYTLMRDLDTLNFVLILGTFLVAVLSQFFVFLPLHELFHVAAGWLTGARVFGIQIGVGRQVLRQWIGNFYIGLSSIPSMGFAYLGFPTLPSIKVRYAIAIAAGPLSHLLVLLVGLPISFANLSNIGYLWLHIVLLLNLVLLISNLWPRLIQNPVIGSYYNDGGELLRLARSRVTAEEIHEKFYLLSASFAMQRDQNAEALEFTKTGLQLYPESELLDNIYSYLVFQGDNPKDGLPLFHKQVKVAEAAEATANRPELSLEEALLAATAYNNYAFSTLIHSDEPDAHTTAYHYAQKAFSMMPWMPHIRGTWAAVLVGLGQSNSGTPPDLSEDETTVIQSGIAHAQRAIDEAEIDRSPHGDNVRSTNRATLALGYYRLGEMQKAQEFLKQAKALDADEAVLNHVQREMKI